MFVSSLGLIFGVLSVMPFLVDSEVVVTARVLGRFCYLWALVGLTILGLVNTTYFVRTYRYSSEASPPTGAIGRLRPIEPGTFPRGTAQ